MKIYIQLLLITAILYWQCKAVDYLGNLVFFGRGQRQLSKFWSGTEDIVGTEGFRIYFPQSEFDDNNGESDEDLEDEAKNYPLVLYLPGKGNNEYSSVTF
eukprot:jgi/Orpsp1_1/1186677/evm.model.d7180000052468.1